MLSSNMLMALLLTANTILTASDDSQYVEIYSTCDPTPNSEIHQNGGLYYIKPFEDGPVIPTKCSNGYAMIDPSLELDSLTSYLSSWDYGRARGTSHITPYYDSTVTFREWWLPSDSSTKFTVAPQCGECQINSNDNSLAYYTDNSLFCYTYFTQGIHIFTSIPS